jgi:hypothetical protein
MHPTLSAQDVADFVADPSPRTWSEAYGLWRQTVPRSGPDLRDRWVGLQPRRHQRGRTPRPRPGRARRMRHGRKGVMMSIREADRYPDGADRRGQQRRTVVLPLPRPTTAHILTHRRHRCFERPTHEGTRAACAAERGTSSSFSFCSGLRQGSPPPFSVDTSRGHPPRAPRHRPSWSPCSPGR